MPGRNWFKNILSNKRLEQFWPSIINRHRIKTFLNFEAPRFHYFWRLLVQRSDIDSAQCLAASAAFLPSPLLLWFPCPLSLRSAISSIKLLTLLPGRGIKCSFKHQEWPTPSLFSPSSDSLFFPPFGISAGVDGQHTACQLPLTPPPITSVVSSWTLGSVVRGCMLRSNQTLCRLLWLPVPPPPPSSSDFFSSSWGCWERGLNSEWVSVSDKLLSSQIPTIITTADDLEINICPSEQSHTHTRVSSRVSAHVPIYRLFPVTDTEPYGQEGNHNIWYTQF